MLLHVHQCTITVNALACERGQNREENCFIGQRTIVLCCAYICSSKHLFGLCIIYHAFQVKCTQIYFDTYLPCISNS